MKPVLNISIIAYLLSLCCCQVEPFEIEAHSNPKIGLTCFIKPDSNIVAQLSQTYDHATSTSADISLPNASIRLLENGTEIGTFSMVEKLDMVELGRATTYKLQYQPKVGNTYRIEAEAPGYPSVWGETTIPSPAGTIVQITSIKFEADPGEFDHLYYHYDISVLIADAKEKNYYHIESYLRSTSITLPQGDTLNQASFNVNHHTNEQFLTGPGDGYADEFLEILIDDAQFQNGKLWIDWRNIQTYGIVYLKETDFNSIDKDVYDELQIYLRNVTFDYHQYHRTALLQFRNRNDPFAEQVPVHSNIHNGVGIFAGYNEQAFAQPLGLRYYLPAN